MKKYFCDGRLIATTSYLIFLGLIGIFADQIAQEGGIIPFGPNDISPGIGTYSVPGTEEITNTGKHVIHYLGTDQIGRDVASRLVHGVAVALEVGILSAFLSLIIAVVLGCLSGFLGDHSHRINLFQLIFFVITGIVMHFLATEYAFMEDDRGVYVLSRSRYFYFIIPGIMIVLWITTKLSVIKGWRFRVPWDTVVVKIIEVFRSIPKLFFLIAIFAIITRPSVISVAFIIGIMRWPGLTRLIRAEILRLKQESFILNARILGLPGWRILLYHIAPNIYKPIIVVTALNMGSAILLEASLSFLQIGLPIGEVSWGQMLGDARNYIPAWWMAVGPGLLIFSLILAFNELGNRLSYHFNSDTRDN